MYMGDSEREQLVTAAEGSPDLEGTTEREGGRVTLKTVLKADPNAYDGMVRVAPHRRRRWLKMRLM